MTLEKVDHCPICNGNIFRPLLTCRDFTSSSELFHVEQCDNCQLVITNPRPVRTEAPIYYTSPKYISHTSASFGLIDTIYLIIRRLTVRWKLHLIRSSILGNPILDFGCGTGSFLHHCANQSIKTYGVEPSSSARQVANRDKVTTVETLEQLPPIKFDVITLWHVLEHIYDLPSTISHLKSRLTDNGTIFIAVPNWESFDASYYKELWAAYDVPRHVWHFNKASMTKLIENSGLQLKRILPMKLDAYYVSLLSEKYKSQNQTKISGVLKAIITGYKSNVRARHKMNYSSLIYIIQR